MEQQDRQTPSQPSSFDDLRHPTQTPELPEDESSPNVPASKGTSPPAELIEKLERLAGQITGLKTFFSACSPEAIENLEKNINDWLSANPHLKIKTANVNSAQMELNGSTRCTLVVSLWY